MSLSHMTVGFKRVVTGVKVHSTPRVHTRVGYPSLPSWNNADVLFFLDCLYVGSGLSRPAAGGSSIDYYFYFVDFHAYMSGAQFFGFPW